MLRMLRVQRRSFPRLQPKWKTAQHVIAKALNITFSVASLSKDKGTGSSALTD